jgi:hypothetical protein
MIKFNVVTMKDGEINIEEKKDLSKALTQMSENWCPSGDKSHLNESMKEAIKSHGEFTKRKKERAMDLDSNWYSNGENSEFFTASLEKMRDIITDEAKLDKVMQRMGEGAKFGTFRRYKTQQPMLVKAYKTRKGAEQNTFWRNH